MAEGIEEIPQSIWEAIKDVFESLGQVLNESKKQVEELIARRDILTLGSEILKTIAILYLIFNGWSERIGGWTSIAKDPTKKGLEKLRQIIVGLI